LFDRDEGLAVDAREAAVAADDPTIGRRWRRARRDDQSRRERSDVVSFGK
jgi:hypothetical protein